MLADKNILELKYEIIVNMLAEKLNISKEEALEIFYHSDTYELISNGIADMHCLSEQYLVEDIIRRKTICQ